MAIEDIRLDLRDIDGKTKPKPKTRRKEPPVVVDMQSPIELKKKELFHRDFGVSITAKGNGALIILVFFSIIGVLCSSLIVLAGLINLWQMLGA